MIDEDISKINSYSDVIEALKRHPELKTVHDVIVNWKSLKLKFSNLKVKGAIDKNLPFPLPPKKVEEKRVYDPDEFNTLEKCQNYVNSHGYNSWSDFYYSGDPALNRMKDFIKDIKFKNARKKYNTNLYNTIEKCQEFVDSHKDITMINDLRKSNDPEYHSVYLSIKNNKWYDDVKFSNKDLGRNKYDNLNTVEDFQSFIDSKDDIHSERDFRLKYPKEYSKATNIGNICGNLKFEFRHRKPKDNTKYNSIDEIQALINSAGYLTIWEFKKRNHNAWTQHFALQKKDNKSLVFRYVSTGSKYEDNFVLALQMYGICYIPQYTFKGFIKNNGHYRYDFYLPDKNVIIEVNGEQHFGNNPDEFSPRFNVIEEQENDKIKYEYATDKEHIPVYYFTYCLDNEKNI